MNETKNNSVKALKKQMAAAVAMVCVAAVALGSSTYAWFVSNNKVTATTTNISAQSNSAYLVIDNAAKGKTDTSSTSSTTASETFTPDTKLYPATVVKESDKAVWKTGYASTKDNAAINTAGLTVIGTNGAADEANSADYNLKNTFYVGTGTYDGEFTDLKVTGLEVKNEADSDLNTAIRVLVTDGTAWVVARPVATLGKDAYVVDADDSNTYHLATNTATTITKDAYDALSAKTAITTAETKWEIESQSGTDGIVHAAKFGKNNDVTLSVYVYYEGSDGRVYTTNLDKLSNIGVTITFDATPELHEN